jgi:hypothetical protein
MATVVSVRSKLERGGRLRLKTKKSSDNQKHKADRRAKSKSLLVPKGACF